MATLGYDGHAVNDTMLAHGQLLIDAPERICPIQATGMDQTPFNPEYPTQQWATTFDSPLKSEGPLTVGDVPDPPGGSRHAVMGMGEPTDLTTACSCAVPPSGDRRKVE